MNLLSPTLMRQTHFLVFVLLSFFMISCKKEKAIEISDLNFPLDTYYVPDGGEINLYINRGNQKYSLNVSDEDLIQATVNASDWAGGNIQVKGLKKGSTQLTVKDEVMGKEVILKIHVVDPYLVIKAVHLIPNIQGADYETDKAIRNEVRNESQKFAAFKEGEILILQRNADHRFSIFKSEEDVAKGIIHKSGTYTLSFYYGGPNRLTLDYDDTEEIVEFPLHTSNEMIFTKLLDFSKENQLDVIQMGASSNVSKLSTSILKAEIPQNTSPVVSYELFLIKDFTPHFKAIYPDVESVELFQAMSFYPSSYHLNFGEGVLK